MCSHTYREFWFLLGYIQGYNDKDWSLKRQQLIPLPPFGRRQRRKAEDKNDKKIMEKLKDNFSRTFLWDGEWFFFLFIELRYW